MNIFKNLLPWNTSTAATTHNTAPGELRLTKRKHEEEVVVPAPESRWMKRIKTSSSKDRDDLDNSPSNIPVPPPKPSRCKRPADTIPDGRMKKKPKLAESSSSFLLTRTTVRKAKATHAQDDCGPAAASRYERRLVAGNQDDRSVPGKTKLDLAVRTEARSQNAPVSCGTDAADGEIDVTKKVDGDDVPAVGLAISPRGQTDEAADDFAALLDVGDDPVSQALNDSPLNDPADDSFEATVDTGSGHPLDDYTSESCPDQGIICQNPVAISTVALNNKIGVGSKFLHHTASRYFKKSRAAAKQALAETPHGIDEDADKYDEVIGAGAWPKSSLIPGATRYHDAAGSDRIGFPSKKLPGRAKRKNFLGRRGAGVTAGGGRWKVKSAVLLPMSQEELDDDDS